jgi:ribonuclease T2
MMFHKQNSVFQVFLLVFALSYSQTLWANKIVGTFSAQQSCPAYVSKNKLTNPDNAQIQVGKGYDIVEVNKPDHPQWYRLIVPAASPKERWISANCGQAQMLGQAKPDPGTHNNGSSCSVAGQADSYVLALSWQPAFCETKPDKPECSISDPRVYQAKHFTLHGLWPNKKNCGINYGFCSTIKKQDDFCDYPAIQLAPASESSLAEVMPSVTAGSCLERHEWYKHGTCQANWEMQEYFDLSVDLTRQFNDSGMAYFMNRRIGQQVRTEDFLNRIAAVLGSASRERIKLSCNQGLLVEVQLSLVTDLSPGADLEKLMVDAPVQGNSNCGDDFRVDPIGRSQK